MSAKQSALDASVAVGDAPFLVGMTADAGGVTWSGAAGEAAPGRAAAPDTVYRIFSMTKAVGSTAAMILIDRGQLGMDDPIDKYLPEAADLKVLTGFDGDTPQFRAPASMPTVRQLATHTSGLTYEFWSPMIGKWLEVTGAPSVLTGTKQGLMYPLTFDPGTRWDYGMGIDWLGRIVEAVSGQPIDAFLKAELFEPLGMSDTDVELNPSMSARLAGVKARGEDGAFVDFDLAPPSNPEVYGMGHALYSTPQDYLAFLGLFLNRGTAGSHRVLSEDGVDRMLANSIGDIKIEKMETTAPPLSADVEMFPGFPVSHSFGFVRVDADVPGMRHAGTQSWAGVLNSHYWFDPKAGIAAVIMTQALPFADPRFLNAYMSFEQAVYSELA